MVAFYMVSAVAPVQLWVFIACAVMVALPVPRLVTVGGSLVTQQPTMARLFGALSIAFGLAAFGVFWFVVECNWWLWIFCD